MAYEYLELGPCPYDEEPAQVGTEDYASRARKECSVLRRQLERQFPNCQELISLRIKSNSHDFGVYYEVAVGYDPNDEQAFRLALEMEENFPQNWDDLSLLELGQ